MNLKQDTRPENRKFYLCAVFVSPNSSICSDFGMILFCLFRMGMDSFQTRTDSISRLRNATDLTPLSVCSDPRQEETPQWKCAPTRLKVAASGPPDIVAPAGVRNSISRVRPLFTSLVLELVVTGVVISPLISHVLYIFGENLSILDKNIKKWGKSPCLVTWW